jgi:hypothetical protein
MWPNEVLQAIGTGQFGDCWQFQNPAPPSAGYWSKFSNKLLALRLVQNARNDCESLLGYRHGIRR